MIQTLMEKAHFHNNNPNYNPSVATRSIHVNDKINDAAKQALDEANNAQQGKHKKGNSAYLTLTRSDTSNQQYC